jgi:hypothetical protein
MRPFSGLLTMMSAEDGAQTQLHCLLDDDAPAHSGDYYSQISLLYKNKKDRPGGWPMVSPNPLVYDDELASRHHFPMHLPLNRQIPISAAAAAADPDSAFAA